MITTVERLDKSHKTVVPDNTNISAFFAAAYRAFVRAEQTAPEPVDRFYIIGDYPVRLRFAGIALLPHVAPALEHLAANRDPSPALTICVWDTASTGVAMPPPPWAFDGDMTRGEKYGYIVMSDDCVQAAFDMGTNVLSMLDSAENLAMYWIRAANQLPYYERGSPLRTLLNWWMPAHERQFAHAAAVGTAQGGILLAGKGGSGKSTAALACLHSELFYAGDDYVLLSTAPAPLVYSLYNSAKLDGDQLQRLPHLLSAVGNADNLQTEKALLFLHRHHAHRLITSFPARAVLLPRVTGEPETRLLPTSPAAGLAALAPSTIFQLPGAGQKTLRNLSAFVRQVPNYVLELGTDLNMIPEIILNLLSEV